MNQAQAKLQIQTPQVISGLHQFAAATNTSPTAKIRVKAEPATSVAFRYVDHSSVTSGHLLVFSLIHVNCMPSEQYHI